MEEEDLKA